MYRAVYRGVNDAFCAMAWVHMGGEEDTAMRVCM